MADQYFAMQDIQHDRSKPKPRATRVAPPVSEPKENRDPKNINLHLECQYLQVFAEPKSGPQSFDCIWEFSEIVYDCCKTCWYKMFSLFCGCCIAIAWGIEFVPIIASHVWCLTPCNQMFKTIADGCFKPFWYLCIGLCVVPCTQSCAYFFHNCGYSRMTRPPTPPLFPDRPKRKPAPKPVKEKKKEPVAEKKKQTKAPVPVYAPKAKGDFNDFEKEKVAASIRRQLMLI